MQPSNLSLLAVGLLLTALPAAFAAPAKTSTHEIVDPSASKKIDPPASEKVDPPASEKILEELEAIETKMDYYRMDITNSLQTLKRSSDITEQAKRCVDSQRQGHHLELPQDIINRCTEKVHEYFRWSTKSFPHKQWSKKGKNSAGVNRSNKKMDDKMIIETIHKIVLQGAMKTFKKNLPLIDRTVDKLHAKALDVKRQFEEDKVKLVPISVGYEWKTATHCQSRYHTIKEYAEDDFAATRKALYHPKEHLLARL